MNEISTQRIDKLRWVTLIMMLFVGTTSAFLNCLSVYIAPLAERGWDSSVIVMAYTLMMFAAIPGDILGGKLQEKFGNRFVLKVCGLGFLVSVLAASFAVNAWMYVICIGGFAPLFVYCIFVAQIASLGELFPDRRGFVTGALMVGVYLAGAAVVPIAARLTESMDVMRGIAILGGAFGVLTIVVGFVMLEAPKGYTPTGWTPKEYEIIDEEAAKRSAETTDVPWRKLITLKSFWIFFIAQIAMGLFVAGTQSSFVMLASKVLQCSESTAAWTYSVFAVVMGCSGIVVGYISDKVLGPVKLTAITAFLAVIAIALIIVTGGSSFALFMVFVVIAGIAIGAATTLLAVILMSAYGSKYFGIHMGILQCALLIASFIGPQFAVADPVMNFFYIGGLGMLVGGILFMVNCKVLNKELGRKIF